MKKPNSVIRIPVRKRDFFSQWIDLLTPFHGMTNVERQVAAKLLEFRDMIKRRGVVEDKIDELLFSTDYRKVMCDDLQINANYFNVLLNKLRNRKFLLGNRVNPKMIPSMSSNTFDLLIHFELQPNPRRGSEGEDL